MRRWLKDRPDVVGKTLGRLACLVCSTIRFVDRNAPSGELLKGGALISGWHGRSFCAGYRYRHKGYWVLISQSRDGEIQNHVFKTLGFNTIRGSTKRGGAMAAIEAIRALKEGGVMAITPDGPRGPSGQVQGGLMLMAQKSGVPVIPVGISASPRVLVKSWDRYLVPIPFGRGAFVYGDPIYVPAESTPEQTEAIRLHIEAEMDRVEREADQLLGRKPLGHTERHG